MIRVRERRGSVGAQHTSGKPRQSSKTDSGLLAFSSSRVLRTEEIPFAVSFEVAGGEHAGTLSRLIGKQGWTAKSVQDCSHWSDTNYTFIQSREMTLAGGGSRKIAEALGALAPLNLSTGDTGAMRIWVKPDHLDAEAYRNLLRIFLAHESLIYRLAQHGHPKHHGKRHHQGARNNYYFCIPLSRYAKPDASWMNADTTKTFLSGMGQAAQKADRAYWGKHQGLNFTKSTRPGFLEFRYFDSTLDPEAVMASVDLVFGMIKAAYEGRLGGAEEVRSLDKEGEKPFDWDVFHRFLDETVGNSPSRDILEKLYAESGGRVAPAPLQEADRASLERLAASGYTVRLPDGSPLSDPTAAMAENKIIHVLEPDQESSYAMRGKELLHLARVESGMEKRTGVLTGLADRLRKAGVRFYFPGEKKPIHARLGPEILLQSGGVEARLGRVRRTIGTRAEFLELALDLLPGEYPPDLREVAHQAVALQGQGYRLMTHGPQGKETLSSGVEILWALGEGKLEVALPNAARVWKLTGPETAREFMMAESGRLEALGKKTAELLSLSQAMEERGFRFGEAQGENDGAKLLVPFLLQSGALHYRAPRESVWRPFQGDFKRWALALLGEHEALDPGTREMLKTVQALQKEGAAFTLESGEEAKWHLLLQALENGQTVQVWLPGKPPREFRSEEEFRVFVRERDAFPGTLSEEEQASLRLLIEERDRLAAEIYASSYRPTAVQTERQAAWILSDAEPLSVAVREPRRGRAEFVISNLEELTEAMRVNRGTGEGKTGEILKALESLEKAQVKFFVNVPAERPRRWKRNVPLPLGSRWMQLEAFKQGKLELGLPRQIWWNWRPRTRIRPRQLEEMHQLLNVLKANCS